MSYVLFLQVVGHQCKNIEGKTVILLTGGSLADLDTNSVSKHTVTYEKTGGPSHCRR